MEKNDKEHAKSKHHSSTITKIFLVVSLVVIVAQFAVITKGFASVNNYSLNKLEDERSSDMKSMKSDKHDNGARRTKRQVEESDIKKALVKLEKLERRAQFFQQKRGIQDESGQTGVTYIRWGKKSCPSTGAVLVYEGYVGGSRYNHRGGASNYICLTRDPIYEKYQSGSQNARNYIYGAEYKTFSTGIFPSSLHHHDLPCAVCHVSKRASQIMIPGRNLCPAGWTREYKGYLMAGYHGHYRTMFTCVDKNPDYTPGTHANLDGALFYFVEGVCGSLPCKPYIEGLELTCAVCTR